MDGTEHVTLGILNIPFRLISYKLSPGSINDKHVIIEDVHAILGTDDWNICLQNEYVGKVQTNALYSKTLFFKRMYLKREAFEKLIK